MSPLAIFYGGPATGFGFFSEDRCIKEQPQRAVRSITFSKSVRVKEIPHYNELSDKEFQAIWYSAEEYQHFKSVCITTVKIMTSGDSLHDEEDLCSRGLVSSCFGLKIVFVLVLDTWTDTSVLQIF
jgi:hypothetical protein